MFVHCDKCGYDSGDLDSTDGPLGLAHRVNADGGVMKRDINPKTGKSMGWNITCPNGHSGDEIHLD